MYTRIRINQSFSFPIGGKEVSVDEDELACLANSLYVHYLLKAISAQLARQGFPCPATGQDDSFDDLVDDIAFDCPRFQELVAAQAASAVQKRLAKD